MNHRWTRMRENVIVYCTTKSVLALYVYLNANETARVFR